MICITYTYSTVKIFHCIVLYICIYYMYIMYIMHIYTILNFYRQAAFQCAHSAGYTTTPSTASGDHFHWWGQDSHSGEVPLFPTGYAAFYYR